MRGASRESLATLRETLADQTRSADAATLHGLSEQLFSVVSLLTEQGSLRRTVSDPALAANTKAQLVDRLLHDRVDPAALELVRTTARLRWSSPVDVVDALEATAVEAALQWAEIEGVLDEVEDELFRFERIIDAQHALRAALTDRDLPAERKSQLLTRLLDGKVADVSFALITRAVLSPRGRTIERVLEEFTGLAARRRNRLIARVTSAVLLDEQQQEALAEALKHEFDRDVRLQLVVDPDIVGGLTVRVGDELIDGSVLRHLAAAHRRLAGGSGSR
jgi:F-type H+-transporting ATPase subunit delta